jgi:hypothetical protein
MPLIKRTDIVFEDETIYLTGHAYIRCTFRRCTFVIRGLPFALIGCSFQRPCQWEFNFVLLMREDWANYCEQVFPIVEGSLATAQDVEWVDKPEDLLNVKPPGTPARKPKPKPKPRPKRKGRGRGKD